jgi:flavin reductase (DIM6/NTAB) family NADH-FMN oxidoreductase RutF
MAISKDLAKKLFELSAPEVIGLVITQRDKVINVCPVNWQVISSQYETPMVVCIGLSKGNYSLETIKQTKEFSYAYPTKSQLKDTLYTGTVSGRQVHKIDKTSFQFTSPQVIGVPLLKDAVVNVECSLMQIIPVGNFSIVVAEIVAVHDSDKSPYDKIYAVGGSSYGTLQGTVVLQKGRT